MEEAQHSEEVEQFKIDMESQDSTSNDDSCSEDDSDYYDDIENLDPSELIKVLFERYPLVRELPSHLVTEKLLSQLDGFLGDWEVATGYEFDKYFKK